MTDRIAPKQLREHVGRDVEVTFRGKIDPSGITYGPELRFASNCLALDYGEITLLPMPVPGEPHHIGAVVSVTVPNVSYPTYYVRRFTRTDKDAAAPWMDLRSLDEMDWHSVVHGYGTPVDVQVLSEGVKTND